MRDNIYRKDFVWNFISQCQLKCRIFVIALEDAADIHQRANYLKRPQMMRRKRNHLQKKHSQGDYVGVKKALEEGKPPNWTQVYSFGESKVSNRTCLMEAVRGEHVDVVELLVRQPKIKLNTQDELGMTALHYACLRSNMQIVKILLRHPKLNPNIREHGDLSPLELSVANGHHNVVHILLDSSHVRLDTNTATGLSLEELAG